MIKPGPIFPIIIVGNPRKYSFIDTSALQLNDSLSDRKGYIDTLLMGTRKTAFDFWNTYLTLLLNNTYSQYGYPLLLTGVNCSNLAPVYGQDPSKCT